MKVRRQREREREKTHKTKVWQRMADYKGREKHVGVCGGRHAERKGSSRFRQGQYLGD